MNLQEKIAGLKATIATVEGQRAMLGRDVVESSLGPLRKQLLELERQIEPDEQQIRHVTILFADVSGFTAMCRELDPDDVAEVMNALWKPVDSVILGLGGRITQHVGDCVMALWGSDRVREDDAIRAVQAAAKMHEVLAIFREQRGVDLNMRVGLNSGPVLLGKVATTGEYTAMGDPVNVASRLEHSAPVGGILLSHETFRLVAGSVEVVPQAPLLLKGKPDPIQTYSVVRVLPSGRRSLSRDVAGVTAPMVGRERETRRMQEYLDDAVLQGRGGLITITGEAGVGKSRFLEEFLAVVRALPQPVEIFRGRADRGTQSIPYGLLRDLFSSRFGILENDTTEEVRRKFVAGVGEMVGDMEPPSGDTSSWGRASGLPFESALCRMPVLSHAEGVELRAHLIGNLLGFDFSGSPHLVGAVGDGMQLKNRAFSYLSSALRALATRTPTVVCLEDLHWADDSSIASIFRLGQAALDRRLLVVCTARPEFLTQRPDWVFNNNFHARVDLLPLAANDCRRLVGELLRQIRGAPEGFAAKIAQQAEGNPFYVEELIKMLIDDGIILVRQDEWELDVSRFVAVRVPLTLTAVLQARLDSLRAHEKIALQRASVIGRVFWDHALASLVPADAGGDAGGVSRPPIDLSVLDLLRSREMIDSHVQSAFSDASEFSFKHALLRDVTYDTVLKRERRLYHKLAAEWLTKHSGERVGEIAGLIAEHLKFAGMTDEAAARYTQAGDLAFKVSALREARALFEKALAVLPAASQERLAINVRLGEVLLRLGEHGAAQTLLTACVGEARSRNALSSLASALSFLGILSMDQGFMDESARYLEESLAVAEQSGDRAGMAHALKSLAWAHDRAGRIHEAGASFAKSLEHFRALGDQKGIALTLGGLGVVSEKLGRFEDAERRGRESLAIVQEMGSRQGMSVVLNNLGELARAQSKFSEARRFYRESLHLAHAIDDRRTAAIALGNLGHAALAEDDFQGAETAYLDALRTALSIQVIPWALDALAGLASVMIRTGRTLAGLGFLGFVTGHRALYSDTKPVIEAALANARLELGTGATEAALAAGRDRKLEEVVAEVLALKGAG